MKQSLDLKLGQHLTITPQLQQAIRLLQLSSIELQQEIQEALESNPLLEENEREDEAADVKGETDTSIAPRAWTVPISTKKATPPRRPILALTQTPVPTTISTRNGPTALSP
jgi:DNA-directed RNA polymerase specialized sigma54-like protein